MSNTTTKELMKFDVITFPEDGWRHGKTVLATVEAADVHEVIAEAKRLAGATEVHWVNVDEDGRLAVVNLTDPDPQMLTKHYPREYGHRVKVTAYPHITPKPYEGDVIHHSTHKQAVTAAFRQLRKQGIVAKQNFSCCSSCACAELGEVDAAVYYHRQDARSAWYCRGVEGIRPNLEDNLYVRYFTMDGIGARELGVKLMHALQANGLFVEWDGDPNRTIVVPADQNTTIKG